MKEIKDYLTVNQVSEKTGFKQSTILTWCRTKALIHYKLGGQIRILESDVVAMIEEGKA
jgi:excisionase family DNA binding protein